MKTIKNKNKKTSFQTNLEKDSDHHEEEVKESPYSGEFVKKQEKTNHQIKQHHQEISPQKEENNRAFQKAQKKMIYMETDKEPSEILPGFYLGSVGAACNKKALHEYKIKHILCCSDGIEPAYPTVILFLLLSILLTSFRNMNIKF